MDFSKYKFRCSSIGKLMTNKQGKKDTTCLEEISETVKKELIKIYIKEVHGRDKEISSKYLAKGLAVEEDSITLLSRVKKVPFFKNEKRLENDYITGEADIVDPELMDTKSCWDLHTFYAAKTEKLDTNYEWQMRGYAELYNFTHGKVCFCLIDTPEALINDEKRKLFYKMNVPTQENPLYLEACKALEKELTFQDIPLEQKLHELTVYRNTPEMERFYKRADLLREWLNNFSNVLTPTI